MNFTIKKMCKSHWKEISQIYLEGIQTNKATFQSTIPSWKIWDNTHIKSCRLVALNNDNKVLGWIALSPTSTRYVYRGVAEVSIYVSNEYKNKGIGTALLNSIITTSEENGFWTLTASVICENFESIALHQKCGFKSLGIRKSIAKMNNLKWLDVMLLERRSNIIGID